jgi:hypothetical protein
LRTLRASEIGSFLYCQRAWWYQRSGIESDNVVELAAGTEIHHQHGRQVFAAGCLRSVAVLLLLAALVAAVVHVVSLWI